MAFPPALSIKVHPMASSINSSAITVVLILIAAASLFTMLSLNQISYIVNGDLYNYNLQFSYRWAMPYWIYSGVIFGLSWVNIFLAIVVSVYIFRKNRKSTVSTVVAPQVETTEPTKQLDENKQRRLNEFLESQKKETTELKEECKETTREEVPAEEVEQLEEITQPAEAASVQETQRPEETQTDQPSEQEAEPSQETQEVPISPEEVEDRQSVL